jgi:hypothetical protein
MFEKLITAGSIILVLFFGVISCQLSEDTDVNSEPSPQPMTEEDATKGLLDFLYPEVKINKPSANARFYTDSFPYKVAYDYDAYVDYGGEFSAYLDGERFFYYQYTEPSYAYHLTGDSGYFNITSNGKHTFKVYAKHKVFIFTLTKTKSVDFYINPPIIDVSTSLVYPNPVGTGSDLRQNFDISIKNASSANVTHYIYNELGQLVASTTRSNVKSGNYKWVIWHVPNGKAPGVYITYTIIARGPTKITTSEKKFIIIYVC